MNVPEKILAWYLSCQRDLPWRKTSDPYRIWLSEIILQQTRVSQGTAYYHKFVERFENVQALAEASEDEVLKLWQGLGYYSRARNLHSAARFIVRELGGRFPSDYEGLLRLKGIGKYTAAAIASIAYREPVPAVDGNVYRVLSRIYGISLSIDSTEGKKEFERIAHSIMNRDRPDLHNQAMMEFGALQCVPKKPHCEACPVSEDCFARRHGRVDELPVKQGKKELTHRFFHYLIIQDQGHVWIHQRTTQDIWKNLYQFPLIETPSCVSMEQLKKHDDWKKLFSYHRIAMEKISSEKIHILSHQKIHAFFYFLLLVRQNPRNDFLSTHFIRMPLEELHRLAVPRLIETALREQIGRAHV